MLSTPPARYRVPDPRSLHRAPIDHIPGSGLPGSGPTALPDFLASGVRRWGGEPTPLPPRVVAALWTLLGLTVVLSAWLIGVRNGLVGYPGFVGDLLTLGGHIELTLTLALVGGGALAVVVPVSRGLAVVSGPQLAVIVVGALCGLVSLAGLAALVLGGAALLSIAAAIVLTAVDRF